VIFVISVVKTELRFRVDFRTFFRELTQASPMLFARIGKVTTALPFAKGRSRNFRIPTGSIFRTYNVMNWKKFILLSCVMPCVFAVLAATAQMRGHRAPMRAPMGRMPMPRGPMFNSASRFHRFNDGDFDRDDRFRRFHRFNDGDFDRDDRFRRFRRFNEFVFFDSFGFPFFPFYYPYPYYYPYGYGAYQGGYGVNGSMVVQVQRRLASAGYYSGPIDGVIGRGTRRAIRAFERSHGLPADGTIHRRLLATMGLA
jgi:hypothetical protein